MTETQFKVGDVVVQAEPVHPQKSHGEPMTVSGVTEGTNYCECKWFSKDGELKRGIFLNGCLKRIDDGQSLVQGLVPDKVHEIDLNAMRGNLYSWECFAGSIGIDPDAQTLFMFEAAGFPLLKFPGNKSNEGSIYVRGDDFIAWLDRGSAASHVKFHDETQAATLAMKRTVRLRRRVVETLRSRARPEVQSAGETQTPCDSVPDEPSQGEAWTKDVDPKKEPAEPKPVFQPQWTYSPEGDHVQVLWKSVSNDIRILTPVGDRIKIIEDCKERIIGARVMGVSKLIQPSDNPSPHCLEVNPDGPIENLSLDDLLKNAGQVQKLKGGIFVIYGGGNLDVWLSNEPDYSEWISDSLVLHRSIETKGVVGFQIRGIDQHVKAARGEVKQNPADYDAHDGGLPCDDEWIKSDLRLRDGAKIGVTQGGRLHLAFGDQFFIFPRPKSRHVLRTTLLVLGVLE